MVEGGWESVLGGHSQLRSFVSGVGNRLLAPVGPELLPFEL